MDAAETHGAIFSGDARQEVLEEHEAGNRNKIPGGGPNSSEGVVGGASDRGMDDAPVDAAGGLLVLGIFISQNVFVNLF